MPLRASRPPWIFGCSVFTRPSMISGKPVTAETSVTGSPASRSARAVPPVEISSNDKSSNALANSTIPVLSETLSSARRFDCIATSIADELVALQLLAQSAAIDAENLGGAALIAVGICQDRLEQRLLDLADDELVQIARLVPVQAFEIALQCFVRERAERLYSGADPRCGRHRFFRFLFCDPLLAGWCLHDVLPTERVSTHGYSALAVVLALSFRGMGNESRPDMKPGAFTLWLNPVFRRKNERL